MKKLIAIVLSIMMLAMAFGAAAPAVMAQEEEPLTVTKELVESWPDEVLADDDGLIEVGEKWYFWLDIHVTNTDPIATVTGIVVKDRMGADLEYETHWRTPPVGTVLIQSNPSGDQVRIKWGPFSLPPLASATLSLIVSTDVDPGGDQRYTSTGVHYLNSGATAKGYVSKPKGGSRKVSDTSDPISVMVTEAELVLVEKNSSTWVPVEDGASGLLGYNLASDEFEFAFCGTGLEADEDYSLIYYADFDPRFTTWGGNNPGALIATMTTDGSGNGCISGSIDLGMDLPCSPDWNIAPVPNYCDYHNGFDDYDHCCGAKIWLVPSDCYDDGALKVDTWSPSRFLFETDLITYIDTSP